MKAKYFQNKYNNGLLFKGRNSGYIIVINLINNHFLKKLLRVIT